MAVVEIFQEAARSAATHRRSIAALKKEMSKQGDDIVAEIVSCLIKTLALKKGNPFAERAIKFVDAYLDSFEEETESKSEV